MPQGLACSAPSSLFKASIRFIPRPAGLPARHLTNYPPFTSPIQSLQPSSLPSHQPPSARRYSARPAPHNVIRLGTCRRQPRTGLLELFGAADLFCRPQGPKQGAFSAPSSPPPPPQLSDNSATSRKTERARRAKGEKLRRTIPRCRQYSNSRTSSAMVGLRLVPLHDAHIRCAALPGPAGRLCMTSRADPHAAWCFVRAEELMLWSLSQASRPELLTSRGKQNKIALRRSTNSPRSTPWRRELRNPCWAHPRHPTSKLTSPIWST